MNPLIIGLFGFGVVGEGIYNVLQQTPSLNARIKKICIKHPDKKRNVDESLLTTDAGEILNDPEINLVVELINDSEAAYNIVTTALQKKKAVVSANKKLIADHLSELLDLQRQHNTPFLYEAAVCGSIPIIRNLEEYYDNDLLEGICGIVNGSTNFILTKMFEEEMDYRTALSEAQVLGFAESDPRLDVEGFDAVNKLTILLLHGYGIVANPAWLLRIGINRIHENDAKVARQKGWQIKLTAQARKLSGGSIAAFVLPQAVTTDSQLYGVRHEFNGVVLQSSFADKQFLYGKGAGRYPTASAVLSDISALRYQYRYEYRKQLAKTTTTLTNRFYLRIYVSFNNWNQVDKEDFSWIEEFHGGEDRHYLIGTISFEKLRRCHWAFNNQVSIIVCPDGITETLEHRFAQHRSMALAGVPYIDRTREALNHLTRHQSILAPTLEYQTNHNMSDPGSETNFIIKHHTP
jgi:homoserine dehydrogenase